MVKERWPRKTCKLRVEHKNQRETMPSLNVDSVKLSLKRQESKLMDGEEGTLLACQQYD